MSADTPMHAPSSGLRSRYTLRLEWWPQSPEYWPPAQDSFTHRLQGAVQNENSRPLVYKVWRLSKPRQQNTAPNAGPSKLKVTDCPARGPRRLSSPGLCRKSRPAPVLEDLGSDPHGHAGRAAELELGVKQVPGSVLLTALLLLEVHDREPVPSRRPRV